MKNEDVKIEYYLSLINKKDSLINNNFATTDTNKIIINYNKINNFRTSQLLYDGILYKIVENKNKGFKITERYFQIKKNCFRYYISIDKAKKDFENPLVQFDIRHIKDMKIIDSNIFEEYKSLTNSKKI